MPWLEELVRDRPHADADHHRRPHRRAREAEDSAVARESL
jgi:hypothetical protein